MISRDKIHSPNIPWTVFERRVARSRPWRSYTRLVQPKPENDMRASLKQPKFLLHQNLKFQVELHPKGDGFTVVAMLPGDRAGVTVSLSREPQTSLGERLERRLSREVARYRVSLEAELLAMEACHKAVS